MARYVDFRCFREREKDRMKLLRLADSSEPLTVLCIGAHSDDIEIGVGAALRMD